jgi:hypothetical protein
VSAERGSLLLKIRGEMNAGPGKLLLKNILLLAIGKNLWYTEKQMIERGERMSSTR